MANTLDWVEIRTTDVDRVSGFYAALWGWTTSSELNVAGSRVRIVDTGGQPRIENLRRCGFVQAAVQDAGLIVYIRVADIESTLRRVVELGGIVASGKQELPGGFWASFRDPGGTLIAVYQDRDERS
jgi:predicted enzyme related to lactoylglutathione lyase